MATLIGLATGNGTLSDETNEEAAEVAEEIMEDGIVLLKNESLLPLNETKKTEYFLAGNLLIRLTAELVPVELMICMILSV